MIYFNTMFVIYGFGAGGQGLVPFIYRSNTPIELLVNQNSQSQFRHFLEIAPITIPDDMVFTDKQIQQIDEIALQVRNGKLSRNEAILALRAGGGWVNGAVIFLFMMFANWLSEVQGFGILLP